ncbi:MAG TPA: CBS domain-containing protein [Rhodospirillaceae bacterium]|nr:CBS domain-containing protein [Rhodospirillaceae bacterium]
MKIKDAMSRNVKIASPTTTLKDIAALMCDCDTGFIPVAEDDRLVGTVTDRDIVVRAVADGKDVRTTEVCSVMSEHVAWCYEDQDIEEAADCMAEKQVRRLAVLNRDKRLVGVISLGDIAERTHHRPMVGQALEGVSRPSGASRQM